MLFISIVGSMDQVSVGQLLIDKSCANDFDFSEEICDNLLNDTYEHENAEVESKVAQYKVILSCIVLYRYNYATCCHKIQSNKT